MKETDIHGNVIDTSKYIYGSVHDAETNQMLGWERIEEVD